MIEFKAQKDMLSGYRATILIPTIQISDNMWWFTQRLDDLPDQYTISIWLCWWWYRVGVTIRIKEK